MAGAFEALLRGVPDRGAPQMGTDRNQRIEAVSSANDPYPLGLLEARADFPNLIVIWFPCLEAWGGFVENAGKKEAQRGQDNTAPKGRKAAPANKRQEPTACDRVI